MRPFRKTRRNYWRESRRRGNALGAMIAPLSEAEMTARPGGQWSVKDNLAHLAVWEGRAIAAVQSGQSMQAVLGIPEDTPAGDDTSIINSIIWERYRDMPLIEVQTMWRETHAHLVQVVGDTPFETLQRPTPGNDDNAPLGVTVASNSYFHYPEHIAMIADVLHAHKAG